MPYKDKSSPHAIERARIARRKHYQKNKEQYYLNNQKKRERMMEFLRNLKDVPCMDCHQKFPPFVMDFDHRDRTKKLGGLRRLVNLQSWSKIKEEVKKCDIVCANCHRIRTSKQFSW